VEERKKIKIQWFGLRKISNIFDISENPIGYTIWWHTLIGKIFEEKVENITKESIRTYFQENWIFEEWKQKTAIEKWKIKIQWHGLVKISGIFGIKGNPISNTTIYHTLLDAIFAEEIKQ
jgi:hypothetical protein